MVRVRAHATDVSRAFSCVYLYINLYSRKFGSDTETQQRKHKYKQDTIRNTTIKSITVVDTGTGVLTKYHI